MPRSTLFAFVPVVLAPALAAQSGWSVPVLETALNSTASDAGVDLSFDGLTLHFSSYRSGNWEIWSATRPAVGAPWSTPVQEVALGDPAVDDQPCLVIGGLEIYFGSSRAGGAGSTDILRAVRSSPTGPWGTPTFVTEVNSAGMDSAPSLTADGLELFFLTTGWGNPGGNNNSLYVATRAAPGQPFGTPQLVTELYNGNTHRDCQVSADGLQMIYTEYVSPRIQVMYSERLSRSSPWKPAVVWTEFSTVGTTLGVYAFSRSFAGNEAFLCAGFPSSAGSQEIMSCAYTGITHTGTAGLGQVMSLGYHDPQHPGGLYVIGAALGNTGFPIGTRTVPLDPDWLLVGTFGTSIPGYTVGWSGALDASGEAAATLTNSRPVLTGLSFWVGGLTWDCGQPYCVGTIMDSFEVLFQ